MIAVRCSLATERPQWIRFSCRACFPAFAFGFIGHSCPRSGPATSRFGEANESDVFAAGDGALAILGHQVFWNMLKMRLHSRRPQLSIMS